MNKNWVRIVLHSNDIFGEIDRPYILQEVDIGKMMPARGEKSNFDRNAFWILISVLVACSLTLVVMGFPWPQKGHFIDTPILSGFEQLGIPTASTLGAVHVVTIILGSMGLASLIQKRITIKWILLLIPLITVTHFLDIVRFGVLFLVAIVFVLSWVVPPLKRPRSTLPHRAIGAVILSVAVMQSATHAGILFPGYAARDTLISDIQVMISETDGPAEIDKIAATGLVPLTEMTETGISDWLKVHKAAEPENSAESLSSIFEEAPDLIHSWVIKSWDHRWRALVIFDGRGPAPRAWVVDPKWTGAPFLDGMAIIALLTGLTVPIWTILALLTVRHQAPVSRSAGREEINELEA